MKTQMGMAGLLARRKSGRGEPDGASTEPQALSVPAAALVRNIFDLENVLLPFAFRLAPSLFIIDACLIKTRAFAD
jgi:hypothetical protein